MRRLLSIILTVAACTAPTYAQGPGTQIFSFDRAEFNAEPGFVLIVMIGPDGKKAVLKMDFSVAQSLAADLENNGH